MEKSISAEAAEKIGRFINDLEERINRVDKNIGDSSDISMFAWAASFLLSITLILFQSAAVFIENVPFKYMFYEISGMNVILLLPALYIGIENERIRRHSSKQKQIMENLLKYFSAVLKYFKNNGNGPQRIDLFEKAGILIIDIHGAAINISHIDNPEHITDILLYNRISYIIGKICGNEILNELERAAKKNISMMRHFYTCLNVIDTRRLRFIFCPAILSYFVPGIS